MCRSYDFSLSGNVKIIFTVIKKINFCIKYPYYSQLFIPRNMLPKEYKHELLLKILQLMNLKCKSAD